ncbi:MAG: ABC transporter ATP-binding protein [Acidobacteriota bacterium]
MATVLDVRDLVVSFPIEGHCVPVVNGVDFHLEEGEPVALVGESGCGKTMTGLALLRLVPPPGAITGGSIRFRGEEVLRMSEQELCSHRGKSVAMIFQEPQSALNPVMTVGAQVAEAIRAHEKVSRRQALDRAAELFGRVALSDPGRRLADYPHQLSGGQRQRVMIAMALASGPSLLVADEPTTALDVTVQSQILDLLASLRESLGMAVLLITHDLGVVAHFSRRIYVMYCGRIVESGPVEEVFRSPQHPYTRALLQSVPRLHDGCSRLRAIPGAVPPPQALPAGCAFAPRCPLAEERCRQAVPELRPVADGRAVRCVLAGGGRP